MRYGDEEGQDDAWDEMRHGLMGPSGRWPIKQEGVRR
jgi:hypothetical protein